MKQLDQLTQLDILNSNQFIKGGIKFQSPRELLEPLFNIFGSEDIELMASHPNSVGLENEELIAYGRLVFIKKFKIDNELNYQIGFAVSMDYSKPFVKIFSGVNVKACTNMAIFNTRHIEKFDLLSNDENTRYEKIKEFLAGSDKAIQQAKEIIFRMKETELFDQEITMALGKLLRNFSAPKAKNIAGVTAIVNAAKLLEDEKSPYYFTNKTNAWNFYNALTDGYRDKTHILDQPEKVLHLFNEICAIKSLSNVQYAISE